MLSSDDVAGMISSFVGGCREWVGDDRCWKPAEFVLWGKLISREGLGPRCYDHAAMHVGHDALRPQTDFALIRIEDLARRIVGG